MGRPPLFDSIAPIPGLWTAFSSFHLVGMTGRSIPPHSSRRNTTRDPISARPQNLLFCGALRLVIGVRGRRGDFVASAVLSSGLLLRPAIRGHLARCARQLTTSPVPRYEALRTSVAPAWGFYFYGECSERRRQVLLGAAHGLQTTRGAEGRKRPACAFQKVPAARQCPSELSIHNLGKRPACGGGAILDIV